MLDRTELHDRRTAADLPEPPPFRVAGDRFGSYGFGAGLTGLLLTVAPFGHVVAAVLAGTAIVLGATGFVRYAQGAATNRDTSVVALATGWIGTLVLAAEAAVALNVPLEMLAS